jgi:hypothetical protein
MLAQEKAIKEDEKFKRVVLELYDEMDELNEVSELTEEHQSLILKYNELRFFFSYVRGLVRGSPSLGPGSLCYRR